MRNFRITTKLSQPFSLHKWIASITNRPPHETYFQIQALCLHRKRRMPEENHTPYSLLSYFRHASSLLSKSMTAYMSGSAVRRSARGRRWKRVHTKVPRGLGNRGISWKMGDSTSSPEGEYWEDLVQSVKGCRPSSSVRAKMLR
jgi:hypothetical protein